ncbi:hypothetical protein FQN54_003936 [Arachnomyces sp. PD_36]|nr:hypothetical protein FQN54_003936 [Arachnomyces sp. PD_36]
MSSNPESQWREYLAKVETQNDKSGVSGSCGPQHHDNGEGPSSVQLAFEDATGMPWKQAVNGNGRKNVKVTVEPDLSRARYVGRIPANTEPIFAEPLATQPGSTPRSQIPYNAIRTGFKYSRLRSRQIRLMTIVACGPMPLVEIEAYDMDDCPAYRAISHAWDRTHDSTRPFLCNGESFAVGEDVHSALNCIYLARGSTLKVWIDKVCINQEDNVEKAAQVAMMGDIYARAAEVIIYLGPSVNDSDFLIDGMPELAKWMKDLLEAGMSRLPFEHVPRLAETTARLLRALGHMYARPWFTRVWVVQEVLLPRSRIFLCGRRQFDWELFEELTVNLMDLNILECLESPGVPKDLIEFGARNMRILRSLETLRRPPSRGISDRELLVLLEAGRSRNATEPVDRVWAFMGLARRPLRDAVEPIMDYREKSKRDYHKTYKKFCKVLFLKSDDALAFLSLAGSHSKHPKLPSWCPNFNAPTPTCGTALTSTGLGFRAGTPIEGPMIRQSLYLRPFSNTLRLMGFRFDYVANTVSLDDNEKTLSRRFLKCTASRSTLATWESSCLALALEACDDRDGGRSSNIPDAHWRTLLTDQMLVYMPKVEGAGEPFCNIMRQAYVDYNNYLNAEDVGKWSVAIPNERRLVLSCFMNLVSSNYGRTYFTTLYARRLGMGPPDMQPGDCVVIINGAPTPFILRFGRGKFLRTTTQLIGEAYVDGIMYGQASNGGKFEKFSINT